jgi:hypothetical protein
MHSQVLRGCFRARVYRSRPSSAARSSFGEPARLCSCSAGRAFCPRNPADPAASPRVALNLPGAPQCACEAGSRVRAAAGAEPRSCQLTPPLRRPLKVGFKEILQHRQETGQNRRPQKIEWSLYSAKKTLLDTVLESIRHFETPYSVNKTLFDAI